MRITQGAFSYLPDLTDDEISMQIDYCLGNGWAVSIEYADDPHPRNTYWEMWGPPMFDLMDPAGVMNDIAECKQAHPGYYIRLNAFDSTRGVESQALSFIVARPAEEPGFSLTRAEKEGRHIGYTTASYAATFAPEGDRYDNGA
jgi:ribulose-bisphosphate carboxylase small chain